MEHSSAMLHVHDACAGDVQAVLAAGFKEEHAAYSDTCSTSSLKATGVVASTGGCSNTLTVTGTAAPILLTGVDQSASKNTGRCTFSLMSVVVSITAGVVAGAILGVLSQRVQSKEVGQPH
jgi:hypothetical protein